MFIVHGGWFRKHMRWILAALLVVLIPGFIALFTQTNTGDTNQRHLPKIHGKPVNPVEFQQVHNVILAQYLIRTGGQLPRTPNWEDMLTQDVVLRLLCLQKAKEFGIRVTDKELVSYLQSQPSFRNETGQYDSQRYQQFMLQLANSRVSEPQFYEVMRQQLIVLRLRELVCAGAKVTPREVQQAYLPLHEQTTIDYVEFNAADIIDSLQITDAELQKFYEEHQQEFRTKEQVKVRYVRIPVDKASQQVTEQDITQYFERNQTQFTNGLEQAKTEIRDTLVKLHAQRAASDRATEFSVKLVFEEGQPQPDFAKVAAANNLTVSETDLFARGDEVTGVKAGVDFNNTAFALTPAAPFSDPVEGDDGYYVLELIAHKQPEVMTFAAAKSQVLEQLKHQRAVETAQKNGQDVVTRLKELVAAGQSFTNACAELKLVARNAGPFTLADEKDEVPGGMAVKATAVGLPVGGVSDFLRTAEGGIFFYLRQRTPPDPQAFEKDKPVFALQQLEQARESFWDEWLNTVWHDEQVDLGPQRAPPAPAEEES